jgi:hypothetical protein
MLINLTINGIIMNYNNITTIDHYSGKEVNFPCCPRRLEKQEFVEDVRNVYDRLWLNNFCDVLGDSLWMWLLPIKHEMQGNGFYYPRIPDFDMGDLKNISDTKSIEQTFEINESRESIHRYAKFALHKYKGQKLIAEDKIIEIPKELPDNSVLSNIEDYEDSDE